MSGFPHEYARGKGGGLGIIRLELVDLFKLKSFWLGLSGYPKTSWF